MIKFTIVTITYNAAAVLQRTLDSVLQQTYEDVEHLIIDGASTDATLSMAEAYKQRSDQSDGGHQVIIQSEPDHGIYDAMNKGLTQASGDYIVFLNAGDSFPQADTTAADLSRCPRTTCPACSTDRPTSSTARATSCATVGCSPPHNSPGARSVRVCWCVIRLFMRGPILPRTCSTTPVTASLPMSTGASASCTSPSVSACPYNPSAVSSPTI